MRTDIIVFPLVAVRFSIVIPTYNRPALLSRCLRAVSELEYRIDDVEVIVADDGGPSAGAGNASLPPGIAVRFVRLERNSGPGAARNLGARHAAGEYLLFLDDDCLPRPGLLCRMERSLGRFPDAVVGPRIEFHPHAGLAPLATQALMDAVYRHFNRDGDNARTLACACLAMRSGTFRALAGFDERFRTYEDHEFCRRARSAGVRLVYQPEATVLHESSQGLGRMLKRHYLYGRGGYRFHAADRAGADGARALEPARFYFSLLTAGWRDSNPLRGTAVSAVIALSQMASAAGFLSAWLSAQSSMGRS